MRLLIPLLAFALLAAGAGRPAPAGRVARRHDVRFLTRPIPQISLPAGGFLGGADIELGREQGYSVARSYDEDSAPDLAISFSAGEQEEGSGPWVPVGKGVDPEALVALIRRNIAEDSWADERNSIEVSGEALLVVQTPEVQGAIEELLGALRGRRARMASVDVAFVPAGALSLEDTASPWITPERFEAIVAAAGPEARRVSLTAYNEQRMSATTGRKRTRLGDIEVNQTGVLPVSNPVISVVPLGVSVQVLPVSIPGTDLFRLELAAGRIAFRGEPERRETVLADLEFQPFEEEQLRTVLLVSKDRAALAGTFVHSEPGGEPRRFAVLARIDPIDLGGAVRPAEAPREEFFLRVHDASFLLFAEAGGRPALSSDLIATLLRANVEPEAWRDERASLELDGESRFLRVVARASTQRAVAEFLARRSARRAVLARVETRELEGPLAAALRLRASRGDGDSLPEGWLEAARASGLQEMFHSVSSSLVGCRSVVHGQGGRGYLIDLELVSGGTGFSILSMPDPVIDTVGSGFRIDSLVWAGSSTERCLLDLSLRRLRAGPVRQARVVVPIDTAEVDTSSTRRATQRVAGEEGEESEEAIEVPSNPTRRLQVPFRLDLPSQEGRWLHFRGEVATGRDHLLDLRSVAPGRSRVAVARVTLHAALEEKGGER